MSNTIDMLESGMAGPKPVMEREKSIGMESCYTVQMPLGTWFAILDNPRQRDTEEHARKAAREHLRAPNPTHRSVSAACLPSGKMVKLDGHTRTFLWASGKLEAPADGTVTVTVYPVHDMEEVKDLFDTFDNRLAVMTTQDRLAGGKREHALELHSSCLSGTALHATSLKICDAIATQGILQVQKPDPEHVIIGRWKPVLEMVDAQGYGRMSTGMLAGILLTWVLYASTARYGAMKDFWLSYFEVHKSSVSKHWLPAEALRFRVNKESDFGGGRVLNARTLAYICMALEAHFAGKTFLGKNEPVRLALKNDESPTDIVMRHVRQAGGIPPVEKWRKIADSVLRHS